MILQYATPVALAATGETIGQKSGVIYIGLEGSMLAGAFFAMLAAQSTGSPWIGLVAGIAAGLSLALLFGWFTIRRGIDQVVVGTAINLLALGVTGTIYRTQFGKSGTLLSVAKLPPVFGKIDAVEILLLLSAIGLTWVLQKSSLGLALRATGEYPKAAEAAGFSVARLRFIGVACSGIFAGLAGAYLSLGISGSFAENMTAGRGFVAIAMVTFGRWKPMWVLAAALLIGFAESLQFTLQAAGVQAPYQLLIALPYLVALTVLVVVGRGTVAPAALAEPYVKGD